MPPMLSQGKSESARFQLIIPNFLLQIQSLDPKIELDYLRTILWFLRFHVPTWWTRWKKYLSQQNDPSLDPSLKSQNFCCWCCWLLGSFSSMLVLFITVKNIKGWSVLQCQDNLFNASIWEWPVLKWLHIIGFELTAISSESITQTSVIWWHEF